MMQIGLLSSDDDVFDGGGGSSGEGEQRGYEMGFREKRVLANNFK